MVARLLVAVVAVLLIVILFVLLAQQRAINEASRQSLVAQSDDANGALEALGKRVKALEDAKALDEQRLGELEAAKAPATKP